MTASIDVQLAQAASIVAGTPLVTQGKALGKDRLFDRYVLEVSTLDTGAPLSAVLETADTASDWATLATFTDATTIGVVARGRLLQAQHPRAHHIDERQCGRVAVGRVGAVVLHAGRHRRALAPVVCHLLIGAHAASRW